MCVEIDVGSILSESDLGKIQSPFPMNNYSVCTKSKVFMDSGVAFTLRLHLTIITWVLMRLLGDLSLQHPSWRIFALAREGVKYLYQVILNVIFSFSFRE